MAVSSVVYEGGSFQRFLSWTNEKEILGKEILRLVKPSYKSLLEVGAGNGDLTEHYIGLFEKALLLEPSQQYYELLLGRFPGATVMKVRAEDFRNDGSYFDLIVASHVFVYVTQPFDAINNLFSTLHEGGRFVIIMVESNCGYLRFVDLFSKKIVGSKVDRGEIQWSDIVAYLTAQSISFEVRDVSSFVNAPSIDDFLSVNDFYFHADVSHLQDAVINEMRMYLKDYITDNGLRIDAGHKVIVVEK